MRRLKFFFASLATVVCLMAPATPVLAGTNVFQGVCKDGAAKSSAACQQKGGNPLVGPDGTITKVTRLFGILAGVAAVILVVIGGMMYVMSAGDSSKITSAKNTIMYALIGVVVVLVAQSLIVFVLNKL